MGDRKQPTAPPADQVKPAPPPAPPAKDTAGTISAAEKLQAFKGTVSAIAGLSRADRRDVLRAVAQFHGLVIPMDTPR